MAVWKDIDRLYQDIEKSLMENLKEQVVVGLLPESVHVLEELYAKNGQHANVLARNINRAATSFTPLLDRLEAMDLIERRPEQHDRRAVHIHLTEYGRSIRPLIESALAKLEAQYPEYSWKKDDEPAAAVAG